MNKNKKILYLIFALALILRFYKINAFPALNADEASIGYNAYSIIKTARDEHGNFLPIHFQSFNDYKPGLIFYLVTPAIYLFGLEVWAVRIIPVFLSALTIISLYFMVEKLFKNKKLSLLSAFLLAISPWHIHFSRGAWEVSVATFFAVTSVYFYLARKERVINLYLSIILAVFALYTYHAARIFTPLLFLWLFTFDFREIKVKYKKFSAPLLVGFMLCIPLLVDFTGPAGLSRASGVGLFADPGPLNRVNEQRGEHIDFSGLIPKLLHNKPINYALAFAQNWASHFHGEFLFLSGDEIQRNKVPETGQLYVFEVVFLLIGIIAIIRKPSKQWNFVAWWLAIAPIAAALTFQSPHALRAQNMVIPLTIIIAYGILVSAEFVKFKKVFYVLCAMFYVLFFTRYQHMYWIHLAKEYPYSSQYGLKQLVSSIKLRSDDYQKIIVTDRYDQPYILFLFYLKYPPEKFQKEHELTLPDEFGFSTVRNFDKYYFAGIDFDVDRPNNPNSLIAGTDEEIPDEANIIDEIIENNFKYFQIVAN